MSRKARSARGEMVDFDLLAIKQQLAATPVPVSVDNRRKFIDEKDGLKARPAAPIADALSLGIESAELSAQAADDIDDLETE